jgi:hypothetical protein
MGQLEIAVLKKYEEDHFEFKVETSDWRRFGEPAITLRVTHNGYQWSTITLYTKQELAKAIETMSEFLLSQ